MSPILYSSGKKIEHDFFAVIIPRPITPPGFLKEACARGKLYSWTNLQEPQKYRGETCLIYDTHTREWIGFEDFGFGPRWPRVILLARQLASRSSCRPRYVLRDAAALLIVCHISTRQAIHPPILDFCPTERGGFIWPLWVPPGRFWPCRREIGVWVRRWWGDDGIITFSHHFPVLLVCTDTPYMLCGGFFPSSQRVGAEDNLREVPHSRLKTDSDARGI